MTLSSNNINLYKYGGIRQGRFYEKKNFSTAICLCPTFDRLRRRQERFKDGDSDKSTETKLDNDSKVTKDNFRKFPETSQDAFEFHLSKGGDVKHVDITGVKSSVAGKLRVIVVPSKVKMKTVNGEETKTVVGVSGLSHLDKVEAIVLPDSKRFVKYLF